ncbi:MAG: Rieske 2Fe-2S domain-containing protein [Myxococcales bacterium]|nr:Rieske 2Fe-2S domain-containing protein [Myxococcales bacterium]
MTDERTPRGDFYSDDDRAFRGTLEACFARSWQWTGVTERLARDGDFAPIEHCERTPIAEPLVLWRDRDTVVARSNVCTHRGALIATRSGCSRALRCPYHGRKFAPDGSVLAAPGFEGAPGFPSRRDRLAGASVDFVGPLSFAAIDPAVSFDRWSEELRAYTGHLPWGALAYDPSSARDYELDAHWALYCENYLEGLHVPYVHRGLAQAIGLDDYRAEALEYGAIQVAYPRDEREPTMAPAARDAAGREVAAYYVFLFPNTMVNVYPWGISLNVVDPIAPRRTRIRFRSWVWDESLLDLGAGASLDAVELEDEAIIRSVQRGVTARLYPGGRYSPRHERGVQRFHELVRESSRA